ncbi:DUF3800 domain-containing protein [Leptospirillum ferrooxidans]|uniref:DUF3800 domain-containing protein n=1 Tax=Leptospirillum ferrooxidans (strain C2-3) TaxID=1162668 RepID=I0ILV3_LEPFC|nr:DUF3800 domain-containing protein [Leptospirillum ferrooxidans]BAM06252.1 hypothetical protein LFE_0536 [Leptospirillum ferrooxidans C2-3]
MLAFVDETGDTGLKTDRGSSLYFTVALVLFEEHSEAESCDQRINQLRAELNLPSTYEFHFQSNSDRIRRKFLEATASYNFQYLGFSLNKSSPNLWGPGFQVKSSLYKFTCGTVFENSKPYLSDTIVVIDACGSDTFQCELAKYLKRKITDPDHRLIKKVKMQSSKSNNLLQLVDYVAGVINRKVQNKKDASDYYRYIAAKETDLRVWPQ